jgi:D-serine deaminase-like pyridoxal phosphate-dependent protein
MARAVGRHGVALRPHMKTAKSIDVARLAGVTAITVSTLAEAEYFVGHGFSDILYAVAITPQKLEQVIKLNATGASVMVVTDDSDVAGHIGAQPAPPRVLIEIDCGEHRSGLAPDDPLLLEIAVRLGPALQGVMTHAGHSYAGRSAHDMVRIAEAERSGAVLAADRLRAAGFDCPIVSAGSSPTARAAASLTGITEMRPGVYMFGDLFQAEIGTHRRDDIAVSVLASVIGRKPGQHRLVIDAGAIALSKDRSTEATGNDLGFGLMVDVLGRHSFGRAIVRTANQEHGVVELDPALPAPLLPVGSKVRILPNHVCLMAAAHDRYFVVDDGEEVAAVWPRINGW